LLTGLLAVLISLPSPGVRAGPCGSYKPGAAEEDLAWPHETQAVGYLCHWIGSIRTDDSNGWAGEIADRYGGRLMLTGKAHGGGVTSLRAVATMRTPPTG